MVPRWCILAASAGLAACALIPAVPAAAAPARHGAARPPARLLRPELPLSRPGDEPAAPAGQGPGPLIGVSPLGGASRNWSGYAVSGGTFTRVAASWTQPQASCSGGDQYASFWVGLDGFGNSNTVEQAGTEADCSSGSPRYYAWYELYPAYPVNIASPVLPGDQLSASVTANGGGSYTLVLTDTTRGWSHAATGTVARAANASAEVIMEAPSTRKGVLALTDFGTVTFSGATVNGSPFGSFHPSEITMVGKSGRNKVIVSPLSGDRFSVAWQRRS